MKKVLILIMIILGLSMFIMGCGEEPQVSIPDNYDEINTSFTITSSKTDSVTTPLELHVNYSDFITLYERSYNKNMATLGLLLSSELYSWFNLSFKGDDGYTLGKLTNILKLKDVQTKKLSSTSYKQDKNDLTTVEMGHYEFDYGNEHQQVFFITFKGTADTFEWKSNFDIGADTESYLSKRNLTVDDEWLNKENHKGFDVAANRSIAIIDEYIAQYKNATYPVVFVSGHSRGGSIANLVAKYYTDKEYKTFCYTYAAAGCTTASNATDYTNIINIVNEEDAVTEIPPSKLGFKRYGSDYKVALGSNNQDFQDFTSLTYKAYELTALYDIFDTFFTTRSELYNLGNKSFIGTGNKSKSYSNKSDCDSARAKDMKTLSSYIDSGMVYFSEVCEDAGSYYYLWDYSQRYIAEMLYLYVTGNTSQVQILLSFAPSVSSQILLNLSGLKGLTAQDSYAHTPEAYMVAINTLIN